MAAPAAPAVVNLNVRCYLRYQQHDIQVGDEMILVATSNHAGGTTVLVVQEDKSPNAQSYLKVIIKKILVGEYYIK